MKLLLCHGLISFSKMILLSIAPIGVIICWLVVGCGIISFDKIIFSLVLNHGSFYLVEIIFILILSVGLISLGEINFTLFAGHGLPKNHFVRSGDFKYPK